MLVVFCIGRAGSLDEAAEKPVAADAAPRCTRDCFFRAFVFVRARLGRRCSAARGSFLHGLSASTTSRQCRWRCERIHRPALVEAATSDAARAHAAFSVLVELAPAAALEGALPSFYQWER